MRILITNESRGAGGGIETYLKALAPRLLQEGHELAWLFGQSQCHGESVADASCENIWSTQEKESTSLLSEIKDWKPDVVFSNGLHHGEWDGILAQHYPTAYFAHGFFGTCISGRKCFAASVFETCTKKLGPACVVRFFPKRCGGRNPMKMLADYKRERHRQNNLKLFQSILVASHFMAKEYLRQGLPKDRIQVVPLFPTGIVPDERPPTPLSQWTNRVLFMGRLTELKGVRMIVPAVSAASKMLGRQLTLVVYGDGPERLELQNQAEQAGVPIELAGWKSHDERNLAMRNADVLIVPSLWPEPFGLVGIEAGCVGLPSVAFNVGGISDWLEHGESGVLAMERPFSFHELGRGLARVLDNVDDHHAFRLGAWTIAQRYSLNRHVDHLTSILHGLR